MSFLKEGNTWPSDPDERDRFGLLVSYSLLGETTEQRDARIAAVDQLILDAFAAAVTHLGYDEARNRFAKAAKKPPLGKQANQEVNSELLAFFHREVRCAANRGAVPRQLAQALERERPGHFGASAGAIEKRIRRALKQREKSRKEEEERVRMYQAAIAMNARRTFSG
jgi:hypothetical protein